MQGPGGYLLKNASGDYIIALGNNQQSTMLTSIHLTVSIMHDTIVTRLRILNGNLTDDQYFNIARQINVAFYQHITYLYILPTYVSNVDPVVTNTGDTYDPTCTPTILVEYDTVVGRFPHVLITDYLELADSDYNVIGSIRTRDTFHNLYLAYNFLQEVIQGMAQQEWRVTGLSEDITNFLFYTPATGYGHDLISIDTERARDGCTQTYAQFLFAVHGICARSWADFAAFLPPYALAYFEEIYESYEDLELYAALFVELPTSLTKLGPDTTRVFSKQFGIFKNCDPKFYTHSLNPAQLAEVIKVNINDYFCIALQLTNSLYSMNFGIFPFLINGVRKCEHTSLDYLNLSVFLP